MHLAKEIMCHKLHLKSSSYQDTSTAKNKQLQCDFNCKESHNNSEMLYLCYEDDDWNSST